MTLLPIVERELRVAARRHASFWLRVIAALVALVISGGFLTLKVVTAALPGGALPFSLGAALFGMLTWLSLAAVLSAGLFFTSDCLSEEKREGTLGLLFLTDLRGYDVVLGKLFATSLRVFYGLLATFPIVGLALLLGGVTGSEFTRTLLALANALFFSLAVGVLVSSLSRDGAKAMAGTFLLLIAFVVLPIAGDGIWCWKQPQFTPRLGYVSPGFSFYIAGHLRPDLFWASLGLSHLTAWIFLALACVAAPRGWQQRATRSRTGWVGRWLHAWKFGSARQRAARRQKLLSRNPVLWLACREQWQGRTVRVLLIGLTGLLFLPTLAADGEEEGIQAVTAVGVWILGFFMNVLMAAQATRFFVEARRSGAMELLLASPLPATEIVRGQWQALVRTLGLPACLLACVQLALAVSGSRAVSVSVSGAMATGMGLPMQIGIGVVGVIVLLADLAALAWLGMWVGLRARSANLATLTTYVLVQIAPVLVTYFLTGIGMATLMSWVAYRAGGGVMQLQWMNYLMPLLAVLLPSLLYLGKDLAFTLWARKRLLSRFRDEATRSVVPVHGTKVTRPPPPPPAKPATG